MRVFLVEDALPIRQRIKDMVESAGAEVVGEAATEAEAVLGMNAVSVDMAIVDLTLAEGSGLGVVRYLQKTSPNTRVVVMTNHNEEQFRVACMGYGADFFLHKSSEFLVLKDLVTSFTNAKQH